MRHVVVVGGGIAGLALAHTLRTVGGGSPGVSVTVVERAARPGGPIRTEEAEGYLLEWGPEGFLDNAPDTLALAEALGLGDRLLPSRDTARRRFVYRGGRLQALPTGPLSFLRSGLLSIRGKLRLAGEPWARPRPSEDETIDAFATRRLGAEAASALVGPMVTGVFAGDPRRLSLRACFPRLFELETEHGGLVRGVFAGARKKKRDPAAPRRSPFGRLTSFRGGLEELVRALAHSLAPDLRTGVAVRGLERQRPPAPREGSPRYRVVLEDGSALAADAVVLAGRAADTARLLEPRVAEAAALLREIPSSPVGVLGLGYPSSAMPRPLDGFGFLVARGEGPRILGVLWESSIFEGRAPQGSVLLRVMVGGALDPEAVDLPDDRLLASVRDDLSTTMGLRSVPTFVRIVRHRAGISQYTVGHVERVQRAERLLAEALPGVVLAGSSYRGVAMNACIAEAGPLAEQILAETSSRGSVPTAAAATA
jgi:protoporphyrinogen/coproporphyrinogen III oxidase